MRKARINKEAPSNYELVSALKKTGYPNLVFPADSRANLRQEGLKLDLGGVGIAVSSKTKFKEESANYLSHILKEDVISGAYFEAGGQPSLASVWHSKEHNKATSHFFSNTTTTMEQTYVRPRIPGFNDFQEKASHIIHESLTSVSPNQVINKVNKIFKKMC